MDSMKEALNKRKGSGLDITLLVGGEPVFESKDSDLAPPPAEMLEGKVKSPLEAAGEPSMENEMREQDEAMVGQMSDYDKEELMGGRKPRGIGDRARMGAMNRLKK